MKLRSKFSISHAVVVAATLLACMLLFSRAAAWMLEGQEEKRQLQQVMEFSRAAKEAVLNREHLALVRLIRGLQAQETVLGASFEDPERGTRIVLPKKFQAEMAKLKAGTQAKAFEIITGEGQAALAWALRLYPDKKKSPRIKLVYSASALRAAVDKKLEQWSRLAAAVLLVGLALGSLLAWLMARRLVKPLQEMSRGTREVRAGRQPTLLAVDRKDEIGDLSRDFNDMVLQLKELDEMKRDFVAGVTHDFGSPLHAIGTTIEHLLSGGAGKLNDRQADYLLMILNNLSDLTSFVDKLLTVARIEAAKVEPFAEAVDVAAHIDDMIKLYESQAASKGIELKVLRGSPYITLVADVTMFRQIVMNLLSNAVKFTDKGSVEIKVGEENGELVMQVSDTGPGIEVIYHSLIFDKFYRIRQNKSERVRRGNGLGLSIVKGLCEAQRGSVSIQSEIGKGSKFTVRLPKQI